MVTMQMLQQQRRTTVKKEATLIQVKFSHTPDHKIVGEIIKDNKLIRVSEDIIKEKDLYNVVDFSDWNKGEEKVPRIKSVRINGYDQKKYDEWDYPLPQNQEIWCCVEVRDTQPDSPYRGLVLVRPIKKIGE